MQEFYFKSKKEARRFSDTITRQDDAILLNTREDRSWGYCISVQEKRATRETRLILSTALIDVFIECRLLQLIEQRIQDKYYYTDPEEIARIQTLTYTFFKNDERNDAFIHNYVTSPKAVLTDLFTAYMDEKRLVHFDSIIRFRAEDLEELLIQYIGLAIDEFKREEEHQTFLHGLREFVDERISLIREVHLIQGETFQFYGSDGKAFSTEKLEQFMLETPLYLVGLHENEWNLAPLIAMRPERIYIYGSDSTEPKTLTVINIFEERVQYRPLRAFPFRTQVLSKS